jgi:dCMP deaminase
MKLKFQQLYMDWAHRAAELSYARRLKVGAVVVKDDTVISYGYNGMPAGWDNNCEFEFTDPQTRITELVTRAEVLHAERNALDKLAKGNNGGLEATMFITHAPCLECAKSIYGAGISTVYYGEDYRAEEGILFLKKCGVNIQKLIKEDK